MDSEVGATAFWGKSAIMLAVFFAQHMVVCFPPSWWLQVATAFIHYMHCVLLGTTMDSAHKLRQLAGFHPKRRVVFGEVVAAVYTLLKSILRLLLLVICCMLDHDEPPIHGLTCVRLARCERACVRKV